MRALIGTLMLLMAGIAGAENYGPVETVNVTGYGLLTYQELFTVVGDEGQSMDEVAKLAAPRLRAFSDATGFEACGVLATDGERFGVVVGSNQSHIACANFNRFTPAGMKPTGQTIHSHGVEGRFNANRMDVALQGQHFHGKPGVRSVAGQTLDAFSAMDYDGGPGYLATPTGVIHQAGKKGTSRPVH